MKVELKVVAGPLKGKVYCFQEYDKLSIGRSPDAYFSFPEDQKISRMHCLLELAPTSCFVRDLNSSNGTFYGIADKAKRKVNFNKITQQDLVSDSYLKIGSTIFHLKIEQMIPPQKKTVCTPIQNRSVGSFEIMQKLGQGGMGEVYLVKHAKLQQLFALKIAHPHIVPDEKKINRFLREAEYGTKIRHKNVVRYYKAGYITGFFYIPMEYVKGVDLRKYVENLKEYLPLARALIIIEQLLDGLMYLHQENLVHRDIKPANFMVEPDSLHIKITDFGLAKQFEDCGLSQLTLSNQAMGTPDYMPPEQIASARHVDKRADIYSLGATIYFLLTQQRLFSGGVNDVLCQVFAQEPTPISHYTEIPPVLEDIILKCLKKSPDERFSSVVELKESIQPILDSYK